MSILYDEENPQVNALPSVRTLSDAVGVRATRSLELYLLPISQPILSVLTSRWVRYVGDSVHFITEK